MLYFIVSAEVARALDMRADVLLSARWLSALATAARLAGSYTCDRNRDALTTFLAVQAHGSGIDIEWRCSVGPQLEHWIPGSIQSIGTLSNAPGKFKLKATIHTGGVVFQVDLTELRWRCRWAEPSEQHPGQQTAPANSVQKAAIDGDAAAKKGSDPTAPQTPPNNKSTAPTAATPSAQSAGVTDVQCAQAANASSAACATLGAVLAAQSPCSDDSATELPELQTTQHAPAAPPATAKDADQSALDEPPDDRAAERQQHSRDGVTQELFTAAR